MFRFKRLVALCLLMLIVSAQLFSAEIYVSSDKSGLNVISCIQEGDEGWICVIDPACNLDSAVRETIWADIRLFDMNTGASLAWISHILNDTGDNDIAFRATGYTPFLGHSSTTPGSPAADCLIETEADSGLFISRRPILFGDRSNPSDLRLPSNSTHVISTTHDLESPYVGFLYGNYIYAGDTRVWVDGSMAHREPTETQELPFLTSILPSDITADTDPNTSLVGRFENMDTLAVLYTSPLDPGSSALSQLKIIDASSSVSWDQLIYQNANQPARITIVDPDENLNCNEVEVVPVFVLVNPGSWNPVQPGSPNDFSSLMATGGIDGLTGNTSTDANRVRWYNIYDSTANAYEVRGAMDGRYYIEYPTSDDDNVTFFYTENINGIVPVVFYAEETGVATGVFQLEMDTILNTLEFTSLRVRDVLVAYYLDPNDGDDFSLAAAYIEEKQHSITSFTDATRMDKDLFWLGRDPVYVQVIDSNANVDPCSPEEVVIHICDLSGAGDGEWLILAETSSNSPVFFTWAGTQLWPVWDALGIGVSGSNGGFQLRADNWKIEAPNESVIYVRYNDVQYEHDGIWSIGDADPLTGFPPSIKRVRLANDISFDTLVVADTQTFDGSACTLTILDETGQAVDGAISSGCISISVSDPDQNEDNYRRERIDAYWSGSQNFPFGPYNTSRATESSILTEQNPIALGIFNVLDTGSGFEGPYEFPQIFAVNLRNGRWCASDLLETGPATGAFVSVECINISGSNTSIPSLEALFGDTILVVYQDPSNHSDSSFATVRVGEVSTYVNRSPEASSVKFADPGLEKAVRDALGVDATSPLSQAALLELEELYASYCGISDLSGLELCENLMSLTLRHNSIEDLFPITHLVHLTYLDVNENRVIYLDPLRNLEHLTTLYASNNPIANISPLAEISTLTHLSLNQVDVQDWSPLEKLPTLRQLSVAENNITSAAPFSRFSSLTGLSLSFNRIVDISALATLTQLEILLLSNNRVESIDALASLEHLCVLNLAENHLGDISALKTFSFSSTCENEHFLDLSDNTIQDISSLSEIKGLRTGDRIDLRGNPTVAYPLTPIAEETIRDLENRGVAVQYRVPLNTSVVAPDFSLPALRSDQEIALSSLRPRIVIIDFWASWCGPCRNTLPYIDQMVSQFGEDVILLGVNLDRDQEDALNYLQEEPLPNMIVLWGGFEEANSVSLQYGNLLANGIPHTFVLDGNGVIAYSGHPSGIDEELLQTLVQNPVSVDFEDPALGPAIRDSLDLPPDSIIPTAALVNLREIDVAARGVESLKGMEFCQSLETLDLSGNLIQDVTAIAQLSKLERLDLTNNRISDLSPFQQSSLTSLTSLQLGGNLISDIAPLRILASLRSLDLSHNEIADISPMAIGETAAWYDLYDLDLSYNRIEDVTPLGTHGSFFDLVLSHNHIRTLDGWAGSMLSRITWLDLRSNNISSIAGLSSLGNVDYLYLSENEIREIPMLKLLNSVSVLNLSFNQIDDASALSALQNIGYLNLASNSIQDVSFLQEMKPRINDRIGPGGGIEGTFTALELFLANNAIDQITGIPVVDNYYALDLSGNKLSSLEFLEGHKSIVCLDLSDNEIEDPSSIVKIGRVFNLRLSNNRIASLAPLGVPPKFVPLASRDLTFC